MMSSRRSGMDEVRIVRRNGSSSTASSGHRYLAGADRKLGNQIRGQRGPWAEELIEPRREQEDVRIQLTAAVLVSDVRVRREVAEPGRDDGRARAAPPRRTPGGPPRSRSGSAPPPGSPARPATPRRRLTFTRADTSPRPVAGALHEAARREHGIVLGVPAKKCGRRARPRRRG